MSEARHQSLQGAPSTSAPVPGRVEQQGVSVEVHVLSPEEARDIFETNLVGKGIQPVMIKIRNESTHTYRFRKADVDEHYIPASTAATHSYKNPVLVGGRMVGRAVGVIPRWLLNSRRGAARERAVDQPLLNREVQASFVKEEIKDADIPPKGSLAGFLYVHPSPAGHQIHVPLVNTQTQARLQFDISP